MLKPERVGPFLYKLAEDDNELFLAKSLHHEVYLRRGYIDSRQSDGIINDKYSESSDYIIAIKITNDVNNDIKGEVVGVMRMIRYSEIGLPALSEFDLNEEAKGKIDNIDLKMVVELSALAVKQGFNVARGLYRYARIYSDEMQHTHWFAVLEERLSNAFQKRFNFHFTQIGQPKYYMGAVTMPFMMDRNLQREFMQMVDPEAARFYYGEFVPQDDYDVLELV